MKKPKNIRDLEDIFYGSDQGARKSYTSCTKTKILAPYLEKEGLRVLSCLGTPNKIPRDNQKTFDYKIPESKVLVEITSIDIPQEDEFISNADSKITKAIRHLGEKDSAGHPDFIRGGIIYYSSSLAFLCSELPLKITDGKMIGKLMMANNLQYLVLIPEATSMNGKSSREIFPSIIYTIDKEIMNKFNELPTGIKRAIL